MIQLISIYEYNGKLIESEHQNRKSEFENLEELDKYRAYLKKKLGKKIYFQYREDKT